MGGWSSDRARVIERRYRAPSGTDADASAVRGAALNWTARAEGLPETDGTGDFVGLSGAGTYRGRDQYHDNIAFRTRSIFLMR